MTAYIVAQLRFTNREIYNRYQARFWDVFRQFNGELLAADEHPELIEGEWDREKIVILSFPDSQSAQKFQNSKAYQTIAQDRKAGADAVILHVNGI